MKRGLLLIDRGSREREAGEELEIICEKVKEKGNYDFSEFCFLEVVPPFIEDGMEKWVEINRKYSEIWPVITVKKTPPKDAEKWKDIPNKYEKFFSEKPGK